MTSPGRAAAGTAAAVALLLALPSLAAEPARAKARTPVRALERLAAQVATQIAEAGAEAPVGLYARGDSPEVARAFVTLLAAELARRNLSAVPVDAPDPLRAETEARARGQRSLLRLQLGLEAGLLHARGDLLGTWVNFWSGAQPTRPAAPAAGVEASVDADAHALSLAASPLPLIPPVSAGPQSGELRLVQGTFARLPRPVTALAAGDLDGDGRDEVVVLTEDEVLAFGPDGRLLARRELRHLPFSATPGREPFGAIAVLDGPPRVAYLSAQRARGEAVALEVGRAGFRLLGPVEDAPLGRAGAAALLGKVEPGKNTFGPQVSIEGAHALSLPRAMTTFSSFTSPSGTELLAVLPDGAALWRADLSPEGRSLELRGLGAGSALADLDGDGHPELVTSEPGFSPAPEVLRVLRAPGLGLAIGAAEALRFRKELARGRILQIVGADLDGQKAQALIVSVWLPDGTTELQVYRRAK